MKIIIKNIINENIDPEEKYINGLSNIINPPYFYNLRVTDTPEHLWNRILSKKYNQEVTVENDSIYDSNTNLIYSEDSDGYWWKQEYDSNNNKIYYENSNGDWFKREFDLNNDEIYFEDSDGVIRDKRNINENIDPEEKYVNGLSNIINVPYFYNLKVTDTPKHLWGRILSKVFNQEVWVENKYIFDSNNNRIYYEDSDGGWIKREYDLNNNEIYYENSNGHWEKKEFDLKNNLIYVEYSNGDWLKQEYDSNNNQIYYEDSDGKIVDRRNINENIDPEEKYVNGLSTIINPPYLYNLKVTDTPEHLWDRILSKVFNQEVTVKNNYIYDSNDYLIYSEDSNGVWEKQEFDSNNNVIYYENSRGYWEKREYDTNNNRIYYEDSNGKIIDNRPNNPINENIDPEEKYVNGLSSIINPPYFYNLRVTDTPTYLWNKILSKVFNQVVRRSDNSIYDSYNSIYDSYGNKIYFEDSNGYWRKREYDSNNNEIYYENSKGDWSKKEYDSNNNEIYFENSDGDWWKKEYDLNNNEIYYENSDGYWSKREFDSNNNRIYLENSDGIIIDKRNINENIS